jgi:subtilisin family serine protease
MRVSAGSRFTVGILIVALAMSLLSLGTTGSVSAQGSKAKKRYIVLGTNESLPMGFESVVAAAGGRVVGTVPEVGLAVIESADPSFEFAAAGIRGVEAVAEDEEVFIGGLASEIVAEGGDAPGGIVAESHSPQLARFFLVQWALQVINADEAWTEGFKGDETVDVAVLDTGIDYTHQELMGKVDMDRSKSFYEEALSPLPPGLPAGTVIKSFLDFNGHGTHVAALIAGQGISVAGVAPHVKLIAIKIGGRDGFAPWSSIILGIRHAADVGADVINMSFGAQMTREELKADHLKRALKRAVKYAERRGAFLTASAGNSAVNWDHERRLTKIPAELPGVNAVAATGPTNFMDFDTFTTYSDYGWTIVDFVAPGGNVTPFRCLPSFSSPTGPMVSCSPLAPLPNGNPNPAGMAADAILSACSRFVASLPGNPAPFPCRSGRANVFNLGTSMSAAIVSGTAALVDSVAGGALDGDQIRHILKYTAVRFGRGGRAHYGYGRVDAAAAVRCAKASVVVSGGRVRLRGDCNGRREDRDDDDDD